MTAPPWLDAQRAAALLTRWPHALGGVALRAHPGPVLDAWLGLLAADGARARRLPASIGEDRLLGGLDLAATLGAGRPVAKPGLLAEADGGLILMPMAERADPMTVGALAAALDTGETVSARDGLALRNPARFGLIAIDESTDDEPGLPAALADRLALHIDLRRLSMADLDTAPPAMPATAEQAPLSRLQVEALVGAALALGVTSLRAPMLAVRVAGCLAALDGRDAADDDDLAGAIRTALLPRATQLPAPPETEEAEPPSDPSPEDPADRKDSEEGAPPGAQAVAEMLIAAAAAVLPDELLARLVAARRPKGVAGKAGARQLAATRGRPLASRRGDPGGNARLDVLATLRAAAPWQKTRRGESGRLAIRREDFHIRRFRHRGESALIFVVDASGSAAAQRLAEAKGAVELLLAEAYVRRDRIALVTMRGEGAELALPPTRALAAAKRRLSGLPGGGGTPMASGIETGLATALDARRRGWDPTLILLTDGKANIARDGTGGRQRAAEEALAAARDVLAAGVPAVVIDTSPRPAPQAEGIATAMGARYAPLPRADAHAMRRAIREPAP